MYQLGNRAGWGIAMAVSAVLALIAAWLSDRSSDPQIARDYEDCTERAQTDGSSAAEYSQLIAHCGERFAGRRKAGADRPISTLCRIELSISPGPIQAKKSAGR
jgi:hypothetical protein